MFTILLFVTGYNIPTKTAGKSFILNWLDMGSFKLLSLISLLKLTTSLNSIGDKRCYESAFLRKTLDLPNT